MGNDECLDDTIQEINPDLYPNMYTAVVMLVVMSESTTTTERFVSAMRRLNIYLGSTMTTESISGLVLMHYGKDTELDEERIINQFSRQKNRRLFILFRT